MMFRFLHMADVHLDTAFQNRDPEMRALCEIPFEKPLDQGRFSSFR